jgi:hypothetical protein
MERTQCPTACINCQAKYNSKKYHMACRCNNNTVHDFETCPHCSSSIQEDRIRLKEDWLFQTCSDCTYIHYIARPKDGIINRLRHTGRTFGQWVGYCSIRLIIVFYIISLCNHLFIYKQKNKQIQEAFGNQLAIEDLSAPIFLFSAILWHDFQIVRHWIGPIRTTVYIASEDGIIFKAKDTKLKFSAYIDLLS